LGIWGIRLAFRIIWLRLNWGRFLMQCKLCQQEYAKLENSHIIPEWMYRPLYNDKHKFIPINNSNFNQLKPEQKGFRQTLLCKDCEGLLSKWEGSAKKDLDDISNLKSNFLKITKLSDQALYVENLKYDSLKKFILSILWRMSITNLKQFGGVELGFFEDDIRNSLVNNRVIDTFTYPIMVHQLEIKGKYYPDIIMGMEKGRIDNKYILQSFVAYGYMFDVVISKLKLPNKFAPLLLDQNGSMPVQITDYMSLPQDESLLKRFNDADVLRFFNRTP